MPRSLGYEGISMKRLSALIMCVMSVGLVHAAEEPTSIRVDFPSDVPRGTIHVEALVDVLPEVVWAVVIDMNRWHTWMPLVEKAKYYSDAAVAKIPAKVGKDADVFDPLLAMGTNSTPSPVGKQSRVAYSYYNLPWPIADQWTVEKYHFDATNAGKHEYKVRYYKIYEKNPKKFSGYWKIEPYPGRPGASKLTYHNYMRTKTGFAGKLFRIATKRTVEKMITALRREVKLRGG